MTEALRVVSLQASNILRLSAVDFSWDKEAHVLTLGGKNGAGKSSVLHAVAMALGGKTLCPDEPIKRGEQRGFVELNLGALVVRREFWRDLLNEQPLNGPTAYGDVKSRLVVKNPEGVKQEPAQRLLDTLVGKLTFDPMAFADADADKQALTLRSIVGLNFAPHDEKRAIAYERRAVYNKEAKEKLVLLDVMPHYDDAPAEEQSLRALVEELQQAENARLVVNVHAQAVSAVEVRIADNNRNADAARASMQDVEQQIAALKKKFQIAENTYEACAAGHTILDASLTAAKTAHADALAAIADTAEIQARMSALEDVNAKVRMNKQRHDMMANVAQFQQHAHEQDTIITELDALKTKTLSDAKYPIDGLELSPNGVVMFNHIALKQASTAEQIRVSVAMGFALNPSLKLLCVKNGNALDEDSFKLIADAAEAAGGQVLMEVVTKDANAVSVFIEDGHTS
jgi:ABC-type cobalamin/Fe3+-siderophores transport system ATPase subunit